MSSSGMLSIPTTLRPLTCLATADVPLTDFIYYLKIRFRFFNLKRSAVLTVYSLSELCIDSPFKWSKVYGNGYRNIVTSEDPATIVKMGIKISAEIPHPSFDLLFGFVLALLRQHRRHHQGRDPISQVHPAPSRAQEVCEDSNVLFTRPHK